MTPPTFAFNVGDIVRLKISQNQTQAGWSMAPRHNEMRGMVVCRLYDECVGGIQRHYDVRWIRATGEPAGNGVPLRHQEIELIPSEPFPAADIVLDANK